MADFRKIDLHMHTTVSDGTDTPQELLSYVKEAGIDLFAVSDHDAVKGNVVLRELLRPGDPSLITGAEFSCRDRKGKYHILGYGFDPEAKAITELMATGHAHAVEKVRNMLDYLEMKFGYSFSEKDVKELFAQDNPGKPHVANLMLKYGYASERKEVFERYLKNTSSFARYVKPGDAIEAIIKAGGIPVLAHPFYGSGDQTILGDEMDERLRRLIDMGLKGAEAFYSGFTDKLKREMIDMAGRYGLYITAGSDYHGKNKLVILGDTGLGEATEMPEGLKSFLKDTEEKGMIYTAK